MKKLLPLLLVLAVPFSPLAAQGGRTAGGGFGYSTYAASPIVFNGLIVQDGKVKVSLFNPNTNDAKWVQVGKQFGSYTVGFEPGKPATDRSPATKDMVILTLNGSAQRIALQDAANLSTNTPVVTAASATLTANATAQIDALNQRLAEARNDPNADPRTIQAYEQAIARQTQQAMNANGAVTGTVIGTGTVNVTNNATLGRTSVRTTVNADGTRTTVTTNADGTSTTTTTPAAQTRPATQPALTQ